MNKIQIFENQEFGAIRTMSNEQGEPMFCGRDVARALGYKKPFDAIAIHVEGDDTMKRGIIDSLGREQLTTFINESGLYSLILSSKLDSAKRFKHWVTFSMPTMHAADVEKIYTPTTSGVQLMTYVDGVRQAIYSWAN